MDEFEALALQVATVFTPGAPIDERNLFAGRTQQVREVIDAINLKGHHAVLYGERGVGKTSLANVISQFLSGHLFVIASRVNCDTSDTYSTLWKKVFSNIIVTNEQKNAGFTPDTITTITNIASKYQKDVDPNDVLVELRQISNGRILIIILDEFDRLPKSVSLLLSDTIKMLSDQSVAATILLVGVADSVDDLIEQHESVERALVQILVPRMPGNELRQIVENGLLRLGMAIDDPALSMVTTLSQGFPYYTHLLCLYATRAALDSKSKNVGQPHIRIAVQHALTKSQETIKSAYYTATKSQQSENIYKEVLLACALAKTDEFGFFAASAVKKPLSKIMKKKYDVPSFARHLKVFSEARSGHVLKKVGHKRNFRFRFSNPLMQPYVIMTGLGQNLIKPNDIEDEGVIGLPVP